LRVGVFADSARQSRWIVEAFARAASENFAEIALVAVRPRPAPSQVPLLWRAYRRADRAFFGGDSGWDAPGDLNMLVARERRLALGPHTRWRPCVSEARLDVAFALGDVADAELEGVARHGVWRFCFGEDQNTFEPLAGMRESVAGHNVVASGIRIHRGGDKPDRIAHASWSRAFAFSVARGREATFAKASEFVARALRDLHHDGARWLESGTQPAREPVAPRFPGELALIRDISTLGARVARRAAQRAMTLDTWSLAFRFGGESFDGSLEGFHRLEPPKGWFWADPFPIERNGRHYIFFEEQPLGAPKAHISVVEVGRDGSASRPVKVLERAYHLSYPFLVEEGGELYMIPETAQNHTIEVYRCVDFPNEWKLERVLIEGVCAVDATLHREDGRWWMFCNAAAPGEDLNNELHLFSAASLMGEWTPHRRNPVKSDVRSSRPAGALFRRGEALMRPGQICTPLYGAGIALHRVTRLDAEEYREEEESRIVPKAGATLGIHTLNRAGELTVTDAFERRPRF